MEVFSFRPEFGIFGQTFFDEKIFDNFSTFWICNYPYHQLPSCYDTTAS